MGEWDGGGGSYSRRLRCAGARAAVETFGAVPAEVLQFLQAADDGADIVQGRPAPRPQPILPPLRSCAASAGAWSPPPASARLAAAIPQRRAEGHATCLPVPHSLSYDCPAGLLAPGRWSCDTGRVEYGGTTGRGTAPDLTSNSWISRVLIRRVFVLGCANPRAEWFLVGRSGHPLGKIIIYLRRLRRTRWIPFHNPNSRILRPPRFLPLG